MLREESVTTGRKRSKTKEVPVRLLRSFSVYDMDSKCLVPCDTWHEGANYEAYGLVEAWYGDDQWDSEGGEEDDEDEAAVHHGIPTDQKVRLSRIIELNVHHVEDDSEGSFKLDECVYFFPSCTWLIPFHRKIYISTEHAWYILDNPSLEYIEHFAPFWIKQRLFHEAVSLALVDRGLTCDGFSDDISTSEFSLRAELLLDQRITSEHFKCEDTVRDFPVA